LNQAGDWTPLSLHLRDSHEISVYQPEAKIRMSSDTFDNNEIKPEFKSVKSEYYLNPAYDGYVLEDTIFKAFFQEGMYTDFLPNGTVDEDAAGELTSGINVTASEFLTAIIHASATNFLCLHHEKCCQWKGWIIVWKRYLSFVLRYAPSM
jgi:hypothetical protein